MAESAVTRLIDTRGVATITLNRADKHNAFDDQVIEDLTTALIAVREDPEVRAVVLASNGKSFSAGADLGWMKRMVNYNYEDNLHDAGALAEMLKTLNTLPKPTIARVQGAAFGGAVGLVSCCDLAVASTRASFCLSEVKLGLIPATISPHVIAAIGQRAARRYFMTAERFDALQAQQLGLVTDVVGEAELDVRIEELLASLLTNSPQAVRESKQLVFDVADRPMSDALIAETCQRIATIRVSAEGQEGLQAFFDKRAPAWIKG